ncbi:MAG: NAD(P)/FAD-dependent oxidoreductase [Solirubrobacteraceae bacterium]|nr:NAD(P)/FAD-dependent oxidoreductase [Solirubrobacteraceae bacterium]
MSQDQPFDVVVIGAGAGGLFTAARLQHAGLRTLVVERLPYVGGRASTRDVDGFKVNVGAIVIERGGITEETFAEVGARFDVREPKPPILYRIKGKDVDVSSGGWGLLLGKLTKQGAKLLGGLGAARTDDGLPDHEQTTAEWLRKYTKNESVRGIFDNMIASIFAVTADELPARVFLTYMTRKSAFKRFGFCPEGTIGIWRALAERFEELGGELWLEAEAQDVAVEDGRVTGITVRRGGESVHVPCGVLVSDVGPAATVGLVGEEHLGAEHVAKVREADRPCAMVSVNFASREPLIKAQGMLSFARTRRLCYVANFTATCPEMAPDGWHLYVGTAVPRPPMGDFDEQAETELLMEDLREEIAGFEDARILNVQVTRDGWPPQRAVSGFDLPHTTPIDNLWYVGDAVKEYANGGTTACAETAQIVADKIIGARAAA